MGRRPRSFLRTAVARPLLVVAAVMGLFAMHGMTDHAAGGHEVVDVAASIAGGSEPMPQHAGSSGDSHQAPLGLVGLCLAVLVATVAGVAALRGAVSRWPGGPAWSRLGDVRPLRGRIHDPPDLLRLSIQRC